MRRKSCNCTKIDPQDVHCVVRGGSIVITVIRVPWGDDMGEGSRREVDDLIHLKVRAFPDQWPRYKYVRVDTTNKLNQPYPFDGGCQGRMGGGCWGYGGMGWGWFVGHVMVGNVRLKLQDQWPRDSDLRTKLAIQSRGTIFELQFSPIMCKTVCRAVEHDPNGKKAIAVAHQSLWSSYMLNNNV